MSPVRKFLPERRCSLDAHYEFGTSPARTIERAKALAPLSIRMKRCATNDAWADTGCPSIKRATCLADIFLAEATVKDSYETLVD
jgi:hypothetical protein